MPYLADTEATYRIRVDRQLAASCIERLSGMTVETRTAGGGSIATAVTARVSDQAALMGVLSLLYDMGATLLSVERVGADCTEAPEVASGTKRSADR